MSLAKNVEFLRRLPKLNKISTFGDFGRNSSAGRGSPLMETTGFGSNPGDLRMFSFVPDALQPPPALVVVLHGCGQTAAGYDVGAGWSALARHCGFALLMPEQQPVNNAQGCFNWFNQQDTARDSGEALSIRQMIARMVDDVGIDKQRIFVTGLSAGGAMTSVMLATYPEIFAAGAIIAGLPFGVAADVREALKGMMQSPPRPAAELGDLVRRASNHNGPWPRVSVWHGSADRTVNPANAGEIVKQWLDVHHLPQAPMSEADVDGYPRQVWWNADGETIVESYTITSMAHGTPLGVADNDQRYGVEGAFLLEAGISSSHHIAGFFGLTASTRRSAAKRRPSKVADEAARPAAKPVAPPRTKPASPQQKGVKEIAGANALAVPEPRSSPDLAEVLWPRRPAKRTPRSTRPAIDVGDVIARALTAAGLKK